MANYHTTSDCGCSQNMPPHPMPEKPCPEQMPREQKPCPADMSRRQMMQKPYSASMPRRQMMQKPCPADMSRPQMMQKPCPADMPRPQMIQKPCPADMPRPQMPSCPSMPERCSDKSDPLSDLPIAMAYVPWQFFRETFELDKAFQCGTIFPELSKPFLGKGGCPK